MAYYDKRKVGLPIHYCDKDEKWLINQFQKLSIENQITAQVGYSDDYQLAYNKTITEHQKENKARRYANTRLRGFIGKCIAPETQDILSDSDSVF